MQFKIIARNDTVSLFASGLVGVALAVWGAGVWSLVAQSLASSFLNSLLRCWSCRWRPRLIFSLPALKELLSFSSHLYGFNLINYWSRNADNLVVGKFFGAPALGVYNRAYALMLLPISQINSVISQVIFPAFSSIQGDKERVKRIYLRAIGIVTLLVFPIMMGMAVTAGPFVATVYGPKWSGVPPILQILALVGVMQLIENSTGWLFLSQGRTDAMFFWGTICSVAAIASFAIGVVIGSVRAMALCYAIVNALWFYPILVVAGRPVNLKANEILMAVAGAFFSSLVMAIVVACVHIILPGTWPAVQTLMLLVIVGAFVYVTMVYFMQLSAWKELLQIVRRRLNSAS